jgi:hypothetical protein
VLLEKNLQWLAGSIWERQQEKAQQTVIQADHETNAGCVATTIGA